MKHSLIKHLLRKSSAFLASIFVALSLAACSLPRSAATLPVPTLPPVTQVIASPLPPTNTPAPTDTPLPSATATPSPVNIVFATGTTAAAEQGSLQPGQVQSYNLSAEKNQPMILILSSANTGLYLGVTEPDGTVLLDPAKGWTNWQWLLPKTEIYSIRVYAGSNGGSYTLTTKVAQVIEFAAGTTSATLSGSTPDGYVFSYALYAKKGQVMSVSLNVPSTTAYLDVFGLASGTLLSSADKAATWTGTLPADQDYIIEVIPANGQVVNYSLTVNVP